jgi:hypothetical protein
LLPLREAPEEEEEEEEEEEVGGAFFRMHASISKVFPRPISSPKIPPQAGTGGAGGKRDSDLALTLM